MSVLLSLFVAIGFSNHSMAEAADRLVAECIDEDSSIGYRIYQTNESQPEFRAENTFSRAQIDDVELLIMDAGTIMWSTKPSSKMLFQLAVHRQRVSERGTEAILITENFQGNILCQKIFP